MKLLFIILSLYLFIQKLNCNENQLVHVSSEDDEKNEESSTINQPKRLLTKDISK
jgi:hypothetical protein